jgi:energy-coupling factor transporter ATP-binding protein EcfA2
MTKFTKTDLENVFKSYLNKSGPVTYEIGAGLPELEDFCVITGKNGVGKSRLLKAIREYIVTEKNENFPNFIVRRLNYGEEPDNYDPDSSEHPLVKNNIIKVDCSFNDWKKRVNQAATPQSPSLQASAGQSPSLQASAGQSHNDPKDHVFKIYYSDQNGKLKDILIKDIESCDDDKSVKTYYDEYRTYFRRQALKKICYGNLEQLLLLNARYEHDRKQINDMIKKNPYGLEFKYTIERNTHGVVEKEGLNELIRFVNHENNSIKIKFNELSPGERLMLHLIVILKDKDNIKMNSSSSFEQKIKQILLLDEPDSHCEPNLVKGFIDVVQNVLVKDLGIQVIMTTHNSTTIFSVDPAYLYTLESTDKGKVCFSQKNDRADAARELASNIVYHTDWSKVNFGQIIELCKNYKSTVGNIGDFFEFVIKFITTKSTDKEVEGGLNRCIKKMMEISTETLINDNQLKPFDSRKLENFDFNNLDQNIYIVWPTDTSNKAWDFMIYDNRTGKEQMYLYQVKLSKKKPIAEQAKLHEEILIDLASQPPKHEKWSKSNLYIIKSKDQLKAIFSNQTQTQTQYNIDEIFELKEFNCVNFMGPQVNQGTQNQSKNEPKLNVSAEINSKTYVFQVENDHIKVSSNDNKITDLKWRANENKDKYYGDFTCLEVVENKYLITGSNDKTIKIWGIEGIIKKKNGLIPKIILTGHTEGIQKLSYDSSKSLTSFGQSDETKEWDLSSLSTLLDS